MDEDSEEGKNSVSELLWRKESKNEGNVEEEPTTDKNREEKHKLLENAKIVEEVIANFSGEDSESETFQDAVEELNDKMDLSETSPGGDENTDELKPAEEVVEEEERLSPEEKEERKIQALECKDRGNDYFKRSEYPEAKELYTNAIKICPNDFAKEKSIFHANRAACLVKMDQHKEAIDDCTKALDLNPQYLKVRLRRAQCYEHEDRLEEALEDYQKVFDADRSSHVAREALMRLPEEIKVKHEKMKEEMIGKLKDLGNVFLRPFGLSTDNFKLQQDPNSGGYSINFQK